MWLEFIRFSLWGCFSAYFLGTAHISSLPITLWQNTLQRNMSLKRGERNGFFRSQIWRCEIRRTPFPLSLMEPTSASNGWRRSNKTEKNFDKNSHHSECCGKFHIALQYLRYLFHPFFHSFIHCPWDLRHSATYLFPDFKFIFF